MMTIPKIPGITMAMMPEEMLNDASLHGTERERLLAQIAIALRDELSVWIDPNLVEPLTWA